MVLLVNKAYKFMRMEYENIYKRFPWNKSLICLFIYLFTHYSVGEQTVIRHPTDNDLIFSAWKYGTGTKDEEEKLLTY